MELYFDKSTPKLRLGGYELMGYNSEEMKGYVRQDALVFDSEQRISEEFGDKLYSLIEHFRIEDWVNPRIEFLIYPLDFRVFSRPFDTLPYPFYGIRIRCFEGRFQIGFEAIYERDYVDEERDKKWTIAFYLNQISKFALKESNLKVCYSNKPEDKLISLDLEYVIEANTVNQAVDRAIELLSLLLNKTEYSLNGFSGFFSVIDSWNKNKFNDDEKFWSILFNENSWLLSLGLNEPMLVFENEAFLGGKSITNKGGKVIDFILKNKLTDNVALIEIKNPRTKLLGSKYRDTYSLSSEISGAINQLLNYKDTFYKNYIAVIHNSDLSFDMISPKCYLIVGSISDLSKDEKKCFELFRKNLPAVEILTFDELQEKIFFVLSLLDK